MPLEVYVTDYDSSFRIPLVQAQVTNVTDTLNDIQTFTIDLPHSDPKCLEVGGLKRELLVLENLGYGDISVVCQGPVVSESGDANKATFQCEGVLTHLNDRRIDDATLVYTSIEQRTIAWNLVAYAQSEATQANRDLNISAAAFVGTTHIRSQMYKRDEHAVILDLLKEFPKQDDGFDFDIVITPDGARFWTPYYPKKGSYKENLALQYEPGGQRGIIDFSYTRDWKKITTECYAVGGVADGLVRMEQVYEDVVASAAQGVRQRVISDSSIDLPWLLGKATKEVDTFKGPIFLPQVKVVRVPIDYRKLLDVGDTVPVELRVGRVQEEGVRRILQKSWSPSEQTLDLTFTEVDAA